MLVKSFGRINDLIFSLIDVQCMCKQKLLLSRILVVQVSRTALQSQFMEQYLSIAQFTDTKNGRLTDKKLIESRSSNDMKPTIDPNGKITLCILVMLACATDETKLW